MIRAALIAAAVLAAAPAFAQQADGGNATPAPAATTTTAPASTADLEQLRREVMEQARKEADLRVNQAKEELKSDVRAEFATQSASHPWDEEWQEQKKKLDLLELNGYLRVRPTFLYDMDLDVGPQPNGNYLFPRPYINPAVNDLGVPPTTYPSRSLTWADTRLRLEPTINISEDIRIRGQADVFDDLVLGSTTETDTYYPSPYLSMNQLSPANSIAFKRAWAEVNTPVGLLSFGRMGSNWGLGILTSDGNGLDSDYGDTVDRISFAARIAGYYIVPMFDYVGKGVLGQAPNDLGTVTGQPIDRDQADDVAGPLSGPVFTLALAKRDTDKELQRKLDAGESTFNYGVYFSYRRERNTTGEINSVTGGQVGVPVVTNANVLPGIDIPTGASIYTPDVWLRFQTPRLRLEAEVAGLFGSIDDRQLTANGSIAQSLTMAQIGAVVQGEYKALENGHLHITAEIGFASGDSAPGMGNTDVLSSTPTQPGDVTGPQFNCSGGGATCSDSTINNFRFNRDYRIDMILWREILGNVTDAIYLKPGVKYEIAEGFDVHLNAVYSRTIFAASAPGDNNNLGIEFDPGVEYRSDDGFVARIDYGLLVPLDGLSNVNPALAAPISPSLAQAVRAMLAVKF